MKYSSNEKILNLSHIDIYCARGSMTSTLVNKQTESLQIKIILLRITWVYYIQKTKPEMFTCCGCFILLTFWGDQHPAPK